MLKQCYQRILNCSIHILSLELALKKPHGFLSWANMLKIIIGNNNDKNVTFWWDMFNEKPPYSGVVTSRNLNKC